MSARFRPAARSYTRPVTGWWRRNPYFVRYMIREGTAVFIAFYALVLLAGLACLASGEGAYDAWLAVLSTRLSVAAHMAALLFACYHSYTWFKVMPKTMPPLSVQPGNLPFYGVCGVICLSVFVLAFVQWLSR